MVMMLKDQQRKLLIAQLNKAITSNNERQLERAVGKYFRQLKQEVLDNLDEYWSEYQLLQGHIDLILAPVQDSHEQYYKILAKHDSKEYHLGEKEAQRLIQYTNELSAQKGIRQFFKTKIKNNNGLFGTIRWTEEDLLNKVFIASQQTLARVTSDLNQIITEGYTSGKGINIVANMLTRRFDQLETWEAKRIARTEIHNSHNQGVMRIYDEVGVEYTQWIAASDDRVRESHEEINGEIIRLGDQYSNGLRYPGDTEGPIEEWINCRCSNAPFVMPYGYTAPPGMAQFYEDDLVKLN